MDNCYIMFERKKFSHDFISAFLCVYVCLCIVLKIKYIFQIWTFYYGCLQKRVIKYENFNF